jgi:hypothetical protein
MHDTKRCYHPSSLRSLELCPRFEYNPKRDTSKAESGTRIHKAIETGNFEPLDDLEKEIAAACIMYQQSLSPDENRQNEVRLEHKGDVFSVQGTIDYVSYLAASPTLRILDWKTGTGTIDDAEENMQVQAYVYLAFHSFPEVKFIETHIVAPRSYPKSSTHTYSREKDLASITLRLYAIAARVEDPTVEPTPSEEACKWCGAKSKCPKLTAIAIRQGTLLPEPFHVDPTALLAPELRTRRHILAELLEDWVKQVKASDLDAVITDGVEIPGYGVRTRQGNTTVEDMPTALQILRSEGLSEIGILNTCSMSIDKLSDVYRVEKGGTKKSGREVLETKLQSVLSKARPTVWLQREKHKSEKVKEIANGTIEV